jgi:hypothetical protein
MVNMESIIETDNLTKKYNSFFAVKNLNWIYYIVMMVFLTEILFIINQIKR